MYLIHWPDVVLVRVGMAIAVVWVVTAGFWFALRLPSLIRTGLLAAAVGGVAAVPLLVPAAYPGARALAVFVCFDAIFRLVDVHRRAAETLASCTGIRRHLWFVTPFPVLLVTGEEKSASQPATSPAGPALARFTVGLVLFLAAWAVLFQLQRVEALRTSFALDHLVKTTLFAVTLEIISLLAAGLERLAGFDSPRLMNRILLSRTPAEFWVRYNTRVHLWMVRNVFRRVGAAHHPAWGVAAAFFVSGVFHEAAFDIALSRVDGCQFTFFILQIPAVLASPALERFARSGKRQAALAHVATLVWFGVTSVLFFRGIGEIFPFYYTAKMPGASFGAWRF